MSTTPAVLVQGKRIENTPTTQYTSTNLRTFIDKATATNTSASPVTLTAYLVPKGGAVDPANVVMNAVSIDAGATYLCPELLGAELDPGDFLAMVASDAAAVSFRMNGRKVTS